MAGSLPDCRAALRAILRRSRVGAWLRDPNVVALGIGNKMVGHEKTPTLAVRVYVRRKLPRCEVSDPVPRTAYVDKRRVLTDVIEIGRGKLHEFTARLRPAVPGCRIQCEGSFGTIGVVVRRMGEAPPLLLTAGHVVSEAGLGVYQPAVGDGNRIGEAVEIAPLQFNPDPLEFSAQVDACIVRAANPADLSDVIRELNVRPVEFGNVVLGGRVRKVGWKTDVTQGVIEDTNARWSVRIRDPLNRGRRARAGFSDLVFASYSAEEGDSGALVVDEAGRAVGLHMGSVGRYSVFCRLRSVFRILELSF